MIFIECYTQQESLQPKLFLGKASPAIFENNSLGSVEDHFEIHDEDEISVETPKVEMQKPGASESSILPEISLQKEVNIT